MTRDKNIMSAKLDPSVPTHVLLQILKNKNLFVEY